MEMNLPVIKLETRNLTKKFSATEGVADISLQVYEHELLTLLGPSGCGKTTICAPSAALTRSIPARFCWTAPKYRACRPKSGPLVWYSRATTCGRI